jgi:hypothetical protein
MERTKRHGLRVQVTVFAAADQVMTDKAERRAWVDLWAARVSRDPSAFFIVEVANEYWQNGFDTPEELHELTIRMNEKTVVLVAPSAMGCGSIPEDPGPSPCQREWATVYANGAANLATPHFDRDVSKSDGYDRPVRQPWEMLFAPRDLDIQAYVNNEPIGPQSSVAEDGDPLRLAMAAATTWLAQGAGYTLHTGAGIRGGGAADLARGRSSNVWEVPRIGEIFAEIARVRRLLPAGLPNCAPQNSHGGFPARVFDANPEQLTRAYQTVCADGTFVALPHGVRNGSTDLVVVRSIELNGTLFNPGDRVTITAPSAVLVGRIR